MTKYHARAVNLDGYRFASQAEAARYRELKLLAHAGEIGGLEVHPRYALAVNGEKLCVYEADFRYVTYSGLSIVEDVKGKPTDLYRLKRKLMRALLQIDIVEVSAADYSRRRRSQP